MNDERRVRQPFTDIRYTLSILSRRNYAIVNRRFFRSSDVIC